MFLSKNLETILICIILIILGILIFLHMHDRVERFNDSKIKINFLSAKKASNIFSNSKKFPQINKFRKNEIYARTTYVGSSLNINKMRNKAKNLYKKNTMDFKESEKVKIKKSLISLNKEITNFNKKNNIKIPLMKTWNFIKISQNMDWGFPYTIDNYIVISENLTGDISSKVLMKTLLHEQFHIYQRKFPEIFKKLYLKWNFEYVKNLKLPSNINNNIITNPDAPDLDYIFKLSNNNYILPILMLNHDDDSIHESKYLFLKKNNNTFKITKNLINLKDISKYNARFYKIGQNYHPNEIFANLIPKMVFKKLKLKNFDSNLIKIFFNINFKFFEKI